LLKTGWEPQIALSRRRLMVAVVNLVPSDRHPHRQAARELPDRPRPTLHPARMKAKRCLLLLTYARTDLALSF
jgi:hypothetical protein